MGPGGGIGTSFGLLLIVGGTGRIDAQGAGAITSDNVAQHIAEAKTAADHEALAAYYRAQAAAEGDKVKLHEAMLKAYEREAGRSKVAMGSHCQALLRSYKQQQKTYEEMAAEEDKVAKKLSAPKK